jgi:hypothetical protein
LWEANQVQCAASLTVSPPTQAETLLLPRKHPQQSTLRQQTLRQRAPYQRLAVHRLGSQTRCASSLLGQYKQACVLRLLQRLRSIRRCRLLMLHSQALHSQAAVQGQGVVRLRAARTDNTRQCQQRAALMRTTSWMIC